MDISSLLGLKSLLYLITALIVAEKIFFKLIGGPFNGAAAYNLQKGTIALALFSKAKMVSSNKYQFLKGTYILNE